MVSSEIPNQQNVENFLKASGHLENGQIKSGSHIGITGFSLSAYDYVSLVLRYTSVIEATDTGYKIHPENAEAYQGLLTFISRDGVPAPPRHIDAAYYADPRRPPILTSEEMHALLLQKQFDWLNFWKVFLDANVARSLGKMPKDLHYRQAMEPQERMVDYARQNEAYARGELTEVGLQRTGFWLAYGGQGFHANPAQAEAELVKKAPLTRTDRAGFLMRRGALAEVTSTDYVQSNSNKPFFDEYGIMHYCVAASPPAIQYLVARMFELGVATHVKGDFGNIVPGLRGNGYVLFAPNLLDRRNDAVLVSLKDAVKDVVPGQPAYAKGRFLRAREGTALVHAIDMGMGGQGTRATLQGSPGQSIVGMRWGDTSFLDAAVYGAASVAPMTVLLSSIAAKGASKPAERLLAYYKEFKSVWTEVHKKHAFLVLCEEVARNAAEYLEYTGKVFDAASRDKLVDGWVQAKLNGSAVEKYHKAVGAIPAFNPPPMEDYFERFVDLSPAEITKCWDAHMSKA
ncbi:hypothetical protein FB451DRAFT_1388008 [Mycena latifolia]|nr:hypothetical protein FB451DRAFT_1388008 [Mycena latifolia]